jgi:hypothetical protein
MTHTATFEHKCDQCGKTLLAYRSCEGETHQACGRPMGNQMIFGMFKLIKKHTIEEAKKNKLQASWITDKDFK